MVVCLERCADLHMAQLMPLPLTVSCFSKIQTGFTFLVLAHLGSPGQRAIKRVMKRVMITLNNECHYWSYLLKCPIQQRLFIGQTLSIPWTAGIRKNIHSLTTCLFNYCTTSLASFKSKLVLTFWYRLTQVVLEKMPLNRCSSSSNRERERERNLLTTSK